MNSKMYGLRHIKSGKTLSFSTVSNAGSGFCGETSTYLSVGGDRDWVVESLANAEYVRNYSTEWYNAGYDTPSHEFDSEELEVVEITISVQAVAGAKVPTIEEYLKVRYKEDNPGHYEYCMSLLHGHDKLSYSLYELNELIREKRWKIQ